MELRHLRYFVAVAEELHFRRAAAKLHLAQPALSEQVRKLEFELGVTLLDRSSRSVKLTEAGAVLLDDARRILRHSEAAAHAARTAGSVSRLRLRVGFTALGIPLPVHQMLTGLRRVPRSADVRVELATDDARSLLADVRSGRLDAAIVHLPAATAGLRVLEIGRDAALAATPAGSGSAADPLTVEALAGERLLLMRRVVDPAFYDAILGGYLQREIVHAPVDSNAPTVEQLLLEVAAGAGVAIVPQGVADRMTIPGVVLRPLTGWAPAPPIGLVVRDETPGRALAAALTTLTSASVRAPQRPALALVGDAVPR
ncbi:MAG: putative LysR-family transcriptional regulator [Conexibacter sp.]|nr:putative LysR-family transcriptional regulator [Conexibacter sp.]